MTTNMYRLVGVVVEVAVCCITTGHTTPRWMSRVVGTSQRFLEKLKRSWGFWKTNQIGLRKLSKHLVTLFSVTQWRISFHFLYFFFSKEKKIIYGCKFRQKMTGFFKKNIILYLKKTKWKSNGRARFVIANGGSCRVMDMTRVSVMFKRLALIYSRC
jgi:hypothetical protein